MKINNLAAFFVVVASVALLGAWAAPKLPSGSCSASRRSSPPIQARRSRAQGVDGTRTSSR